MKDKIDLLGMLATSSFGGVLAYVFYKKRENLSFKIFELAVFVSTAAFFGFISVSFIPSDYSQYSYGVSGIAGLIGHETVKYLSKEGATEVLKQIIEIIKKRV